MMQIEEEKTSNTAVQNLEAKGKSKNKRKRAKASKTSEEVERQRMTHIAVERNRRKQMNEHLQMLRSLMPAYYVHRVLTNNSISYFCHQNQIISMKQIFKT